MDAWRKTAQDLRTEFFETSQCFFRNHMNFPYLSNVEQHDSALLDQYPWTKLLRRSLRTPGLARRPRYSPVAEPTAGCLALAPRNSLQSLIVHVTNL
ncbi:hypothetical protein [Populibacterium corticicola]|uniref:hypothetical protein n=1 Tax=Populibacterium corticicola TaxID=1812826 RepID=UPI00366BEA96